MRIPVTLLTALCLLLAAGCSEKATSPDPIETNQPVPEVSEVPGDVMELLEVNTEVALDPVPAAPDTPSDGLVAPSWPDCDIPENADVYSVTFLWGQFYGSTTPDYTATDWSGELSVNGVAVVHPRLTIDFEPETDSLIPNDIEAMAGWASQTLMDFDGINFLVFLDKDVTYIQAPTLTFSTGPIEISFDFSDLERFAAFYMLDGGNALAVHSRKIWPDRCPGGFLEGEWIRDDNTGSQGRIEGLWIDYKGDPLGLIYGEFWTSNDGSREFSGYVTGYILTYIIAEFKGRWWYDDPRLCPAPWCGTGHGWFRGHFVYADGSEKGGNMMGELGHMDALTDAATLPYHGVWHDFCPWDAVEIGSITD